MIPEKTSVLIVGAGPAGLSAAISLVHHGCKDIVIVDAVDRTATTSRAVAIHAATLEALESVGCADKLVELGVQCESCKVWNRTAHFFTLDLTVLAQYTKYPYVLILPQDKTEVVLEEHLKGLGIDVQRPYKAVGIKGDADESGNTEVMFECGEVIKAQYVIGADGSKSVIRQLSGVGFTDPDGLPVDESLAQIVLADVIFSSKNPLLPTNNVILTFSERSFFFVIPLQDSAAEHSYDSDTVYRIGFNVPTTLGPPPSSPPVLYLQERLNAHGPLVLSSNPDVNPNPIHITKTTWSTRFRTHAAIADKFVFRLHTREDTLGGYIFLIGDAAHIHSPAGGQGMNLGIRDAIGLGPALVAHIGHGTVPSTEEGDPLYIYGEARRISAQRVIRLTKRIMGVMSALGTNRVVDVQYWILRLLGIVPAVRRMIAWQMSGLGNR